MHSDREWRDMKLHRPQEFAEAVEWDRTIRHGLPGLRGEAFVHSSLQPLDQVDFRNAEDHGQLAMCDAGGCGT
jgi:hypothetical protein